MSKIARSAEAVWDGNLRQGKGRITSGSGVLNGAAYGFKTRFEEEPGTNPEELIAAAHAACFSMALASRLDGNGYRPERIETKATCTLLAQEGGGFTITTMQLATRVKVPGIEADAFEQLAQDAKAGCPVSKALHGGPRIDLDATLV